MQFNRMIYINICKHFRCDIFFVFLRIISFFLAFFENLFSNWRKITFERNSREKVLAKFALKNTFRKCQLIVRDYNFRFQSSRNNSWDFVRIKTLEDWNYCKEKLFSKANPRRIFESLNIYRSTDYSKKIRFYENRI